MPEMKKDTQMLVGYIAGGLQVIGMYELLSDIANRVFGSVVFVFQPVSGYASICILRCTIVPYR